MARINRRDFFKMVGVTGATTGLTACIDVETPVEQVLPYVVQPDQVTPGLPTLFSSVCEGCSAGCGAVLRVREGRVVFLAGNPDSTVGRGGLCASGVASTQDTYDPDRYTGPMSGGASLSWDDAIGKLADAASKGGVSWIGRYRTGALGRLISEFVAATGGSELHWEPLGYEALAKAAELAFGAAAVPRYVVDQAEVIVSFGADWLQTWLSPVDHNAGWSAARDPAEGGFVAQFYAIEPRLSHTGTRCDTWWAPKPGTEAGVAQALAKLVADKKGSANGAEAWLANVDPAANAAAAGIALEKLQSLADKLAARPSLVFPGGATTQGQNATHLALATLVLNLVCGNIGRSVRLTQGTQLGTVGSFAQVEALLADCAAGKVSTLVIDELDLAFNLPSNIDVAGALSKVANLFVVTNRPLDGGVDNTTILPPGTFLENWGDVEPVVGHHALGQPGMLPLHDTRSLGDVLLTAAAKAGLGTTPASDAEGDKPAGAVAAEPQIELVPEMVNGEKAVASFDAVDFHRYLAGHWHETLFTQFRPADSFKDWWVDCLQRGGWSREIPEAAVTLQQDAPAPNAGTAAGSMALLLYPHAHLFDGRHANKAWMQEIPHPVSGYAWVSWAELSPATAKKLGVDATNTVKVESSGQSVELNVKVAHGLPDDMVAVVLGNGHTGGSRYEKGWGANAFKLLTGAKDDVSGALAFQGQTATVSKSSSDVVLKDLKGSEGMDNRPVALNAYVGDVLAGKNVHVGEGMGIHVVEDPRLVEAGIHDMFPEPEHPTYRFAMAIDLDKCTGCGACEAACMSENNVPIVGPEQHKRYRYQGWIRLDRFWEGEDSEHPDVRYLPAICQQCAHAPCEGVCPVVATYHNLDGLNAMIYNRCVGTRYCANNCPYSARRFNWHTFRWPEAYELMLNPDVSTREMGVMEKCTFCVQRLRRAKAEARPDMVADATLERITACAEVCPGGAITVGNALDPESKVSKLFKDPRSYQLFGELNTKNGVQYTARIAHEKSLVSSYSHASHGGGHEGEDHSSEASGDAEHH